MTIHTPVKTTKSTPTRRPTRRPAAARQQVAVIGLGYVGLPLAVLAGSKGYKVTGIDADASKVASIKDKRVPFVDAELERALGRSNLVASQSFDEASKADIVIVCVPTPVDGAHNPDLGPLKAACTQLAKRLRPGQLVIIESTINPGVCDDVVLPLLERASGLASGRDFYLAHCPERINPGDPKWHVGNIARVVGAPDAESLRLAVEFYRSIINAPIRAMGSLKEAEAVKVVENTFRDVNIAFVSELARSFTKLGIDVTNVIDGAATKPFGFMPFYPGAGVGGHCIPVDPYYLIEYASQNGFDHQFLKLARRINNAMPEFVVEQLSAGLAEGGQKLKGAKVVLLGLSYKPDVGDLRESPSLDILKQLSAAGADVTVYDPFVQSVSLGGDLFYESRPDGKTELERAISGADAVVVATAHRQFKALNGQKFAKLGVKLVVDGRNCLNKADILAAGLSYKGIGR